MSPDQALAILANFQNASPADRQAACNSIAMTTPVWAKQAFSRDQKIVALLQQMNREFNLKLAALVTVIKSLGGAIPDAPADENEGSPEESVHAPSRGNTPRMNADGTEMTPEQAAIEDLMDSETAGMAPNPNAPPPSAMPAAVIPDGTPIEVPVAAAPVPPIVAPPRTRNGSAQPKA